MRRLWGRLNSVNVQKAAWALGELDLPYEQRDAGGEHGVVDDPAYRALNPNGLVPTFEEDGFVLWESNSILRYLADAYGGALLPPADARGRAEVSQWLDWQATTFTPAMRDAFWHLLRTREADRDHRAVARSLQRTELLAAMLDRHLAGRSYVAGDTFGIADIAVGAAAHRWLNLPVERTERAALLRWYAGLAVRPAAASVLPARLS